MRRDLDDKKLSKDKRYEVVEMVLAVYSGVYKPSEGAGKLNDMGFAITPKEIKDNADMLRDRIDGVMMTEQMTNFQTKQVLHYLVVHAQGEGVKALWDCSGELTTKQKLMYAKANLMHAEVTVDLLQDALRDEKKYGVDE